MALKRLRAVALATTSPLALNLYLTPIDPRRMRVDRPMIFNKQAPADAARS